MEECPGSIHPPLSHQRQITTAHHRSPHAQICH
jgi:hypothetical protein